MTKWEEKLLNKVRKVIECGWGGCKITISSNGKRKSIRQWFDELDDEEKKRLDR